MCFSATASFVTAGFLAVAGITAIVISKSKSHYMLAAIPLLFAVQQASEGVAWLTHANTGHRFLHYLSTDIFLVFAFLIWPLWIPSALFIAEKIKIRRRGLAGLMVIGFLLFALNMFELTFYQNSMTIITHHICYGIGFPSHIPYDFYLLMYACAIVLPFFITSLRWSWVFGLLLSASLIFTYFAMTEAFTSVWCFFAAVLSVSVIFVIKENQ